MTQKQIKQFCKLSDTCKDFLKNAIDQLGISARAYDKILKVSRTIADLEQEKDISIDHICEAIQFRYLDRTWKN